MNKPRIILEPANKGSTIIERDRINLILDRAGARGLKGEQGEIGPQGPQGEKGDTGEVTQDEFDGLEQDFNQHKLNYIEQRQQDQLKVATVEKDINDYKSTMASVNVNQEAKQNVSGYGTISLPKNTANGQVSVSMKGNTEVDDEGNTKSTISSSRLKSVGKNFVRNGNGEEGLKYWNPVTLNSLIFNGEYFEKVAGTGLEIYSEYFKLPIGQFRLSSIGRELVGPSLQVDLLDENGVSVGKYYHTSNLTTKEVAINLTESKNVRIKLHTGNASNHFMIKQIQLEEGSVATPYEPYTESTQYLPNIGELRSLLTAKDEIRVSGGKAELIQRVRKNELGELEELAEPIITPINVSGTLLSNPSGTVYVENVAADAGIYTTKFDIKELQLPIKSIDKLIKYNFETGVQAVLDTTLAVINEDKLSFTHPNLTDKDMVFVDYFYDVESTLGETTIEYLDSRHTIKDIVNNKFYKWDIKSTNGVPTVNLTEVL